MTTKLREATCHHPSAGGLAPIPERDEEFWLNYRNLDTLETLGEVEAVILMLYVDTGDLDGYADMLTLQQLRRLFGRPTLAQA